MKKIILWSVVLIFVIGLAGGAFWWLRRPQVITFGDNAKLTLLAVEYGKRHAVPAVKTSAKPTAGAAARRGTGSFTTTNDTLVLWVLEEYDSTDYHNFQFYASDLAGTACVQTLGRNYGNGQAGSQIVAVQLDAFPRRQGKFVVRVQEQYNGGQEMAEQKFAVANPARGPFAKWAAEPLPVTNDEGDVSVTLTKLAAGADMPYKRNNDDPDDVVNKGVQATFHVEQGGKPVSNWEPMSVVTSDATGNRVTGPVARNDWQDGNDAVTYQNGLWPDEAAWKVRMEFSQKSDFSPGELWTVQKIPLEPGRLLDFRNALRNNTNSAFAETDLNGVHLKIFPAKQFTDAPPNSRQAGGFQLQITPPLPAGMRMTIIKLTDDQGQDVQRNGTRTSTSAKATTYGYQFGDLGDAKSLNFTIALHKSHFIEFTTKPEIAPAEPAATNQ